MSWRPHHLAETLAGIEQQYMRGDITLTEWEQARSLAIADDNAEQRQIDKEAAE